MGLVGDHGEAFALRCGQLAHCFKGEGEGLDGAHHDLLVAREGRRELAALAAFLVGDRGHHAAGALEVEQRLLQLGIDDVAVGDHQHGVEDLLVPGVMQLGQEVCRPGDGVGLARTRRVLDQVLAARPVVEHGPLELAGDVELMVTGEDDVLDLLLLVALGDQVAAQDFQPALPSPYLLPEIGRPVATCRVDRITRRAFVAQVEGQERRGRAGELGHHMDFAVAHREMHQCTGRERQ